MTKFKKCLIVCLNVALLLGCVGIVLFVRRLSGEYEPGKPEFGFLYPASRQRTEDNGYINIFEENAEKYKTLKKVFS